MPALPVREQALDARAGPGHAHPIMHQPPASGLFVTLEGGEGAGKSTLIQALKARAEALGHEVVVTREPGGTRGAEEIRALLVTGEAERWSPLSELLLFYAARQDHLERLIRPALARGAVVLCDRFADSTRAYQGVAGGTDPATVEAVDALVVGKSQPDLTLILDLDPQVGLARAAARRGTEARFESKALAFHQALRAAYAGIAAGHPTRCRMVDAGAAPDVVAQEAFAHLEPLLRQLEPRP
jgi:dTMP kinase